MNSDRADWVGLTVGEGRFQILSKLGEGGMGFVYQAYDRILDTDVVIKVPRSSMLDDPEFKARFARENRALVKLQHPHIVNILFVGEDHHLPYAVMQFLPGGDLKDRQTRAGGGIVAALPPADLATWVPGIAKALDFIHGEGFIHRDVKPANILFDGHGNVFLSDFGVAKVVSEKQTQANTSLTGTGMVLGTPEYMAPELIMGEYFNGLVDQYALAITVYELLCGRTPFEGAKSESILVRQVTEQVPPLQKVNSTISEELCDVVMQGLEKKPEHRYPTCSAFSEAVLSALSGRTETRSHGKAKTGRKPVPPPPQAELPPLPPLSDQDVIEPVLVDSPPSRETARMGQVGTASHSALNLSSPVLSTGPGASSNRPLLQNLLALWLGLAVVFCGFVSALAMMSSSEPSPSDSTGELSKKEQLLAIPKAKRQWDRDFKNPLGMKMLCISPGRYLSNDSASDDWKNWKSFKEPYWIAESEVTVAQYLQFVSEQKSSGVTLLPQWLLSEKSVFVDSEKSPYHLLAPQVYQNGSPITGVSFEQVAKFCTWLSQKDRELTYRLPTEEQGNCAFQLDVRMGHHVSEMLRDGKQAQSATGKRLDLKEGSTLGFRVIAVRE